MEVSKSLMERIYQIFPGYRDTDFIMGTDSFQDVQIDDAELENGFWYFKNKRKGLIKRFVLERTKMIEKVCVVTLIKKPDGKFTPRFDFEIWNITKKAVEEFNKESPDENLIKARVNLDSCYEKVIALVEFIRAVKDIDFQAESYAFIDKNKKALLEDEKNSAIASLVERYGPVTSNKDLSILQNRRQQLTRFDDLLNKPEYFEKEHKELEAKTGAKKRVEDVWQTYFEENPWVFGYGLQLVACEGLDDKKLEQTVVGTDEFTKGGKRIDALLKTKGNISKFLFCEIKTHAAGNLIEPYDRPHVHVPAKELRGAVAQIQKTIHKVTLKFQENYHRPIDKDGDPTGEEILFVRPRGVVVIGKLDDFKTESGDVNYEKLSSFEIYRQQVNGIDILTFDELLARAKFIVDAE